MKKLLLTCCGLLLLGTCMAQTSPKDKAPNTKDTSYSLLWGLFKSKNYTGKPVHFSVSVSAPRVVTTKGDTTQYKKALWGAVQWAPRQK